MIRQHAIGDISVPAKPGFRIICSSIWPYEKADPVVSKITGEIGSAAPDISRTVRHYRRAKLVRHYLKNTENVSAESRFKRSTHYFWHSHGKFSVVVACPDVKRQLALPETVDTAQANRSVSRISQENNSPENERANNNDDQQSNAGKSRSAPPKIPLHAASMNCLCRIPSREFARPVRQSFNRFVVFALFLG